MLLLLYDQMFITCQHNALIVYIIFLNLLFQTKIKENETILFCY